MNIARVLVGLLASLLLASCTLSQRDPTGFIPMREAPEPGYTRISSYFGIEVTGGTFSPRRILFFYIQADGQSKELIGANLFPVYESRQGAYAISKDGRSFLYMHDERLNQGSLNKGTGLYQFIHGSGDRLMDGNARSGIYINDALPSNAIVFRRNCSEGTCSEVPIIIRSTEGTEETRQQPNKLKRSNADPQQCQNPSLYEIADAHPEIRWISTQRGGGCILRPDVDQATIGAAEYMSSGLYRFVRKCRIDDQTIYRLFEYKNKGLPYLLRLHFQQVDPKTYVVIGSHHKTSGAYNHIVSESANFASGIELCSPEELDSK